MDNQIPEKSLFEWKWLARVQLQMSNSVRAISLKRKIKY